jgi:hypothetical protein
MKKIICLLTVGIICLFLGSLLITSELIGFPLIFELTGYAIVKGYVVDKDTKLPIPISYMFESAGYGLSSGSSNGTIYQEHVMLGTYNITICAGGYLDYKILNYQVLEPKVYDLGIIEMTKASYLGARAKVEFIKVFVNGLEKNYASEGDSVYFVIGIRNTNTSDRGWFWVQLYNNKTKETIYQHDTFDVNAGDLLLINLEGSPIKMPNETLYLRLDVGHRIGTSWGEKVLDETTYIAITLVLSSYSYKLSVGIILVIVGTVCIGTALYYRKTSTTLIW